MQINSNKTIIFTPAGISFVLDVLATAPLPWNRTNPLINDIMRQLDAQKESNGATAPGNSADSAGGRDSGDSAGGVLSVEDIQSTDST